MKKFLTLCTALAMCLALAASVAAFEGVTATEEASLERQNSFGIFDEIDPFDHSLEPGRLYEIERWRLYTNLSNYEQADGYYLIGTSGKLGPGSISFFYETTKEELEADDLDDNDWLGTENLAPAGTSYTGTDDVVTTEYDARSYDFEHEDQNFVLAYGMDFGMYSLGLRYSPEFEEESESFALTGFAALGAINIGDAVSWDVNPLTWPISEHDEILADASGGGWTCLWGDYSENLQQLLPSGNFSRSAQTITYGNVAHSESHTVTRADDFGGGYDVDEDNHEFVVGSHIRPSEEWDVELIAGYTAIDRELDGSATYSYSFRESQTGAGTDFVLARVDGYSDTWTMTSRWDGEFLGCFDGYTRDGDGWQVGVEPRYNLNEVVTLELGLEYETADGDANGNWTQNVAISRDLTTATGANTQTWRGSQSFDNSWDGDWDEDGYSVEPKVFLSYGPVLFGLGVGYSRVEEELNARQRCDMTGTWSYDDGDGVSTAADWTAAGSYTAYHDWDIQQTETTWAFPVAVRFGVTDKLTIRAGAEYRRVNTEEDWSYAFIDTAQDDLYTITDGTGTVVRAGVDNYVDAGGTLRPYDASSEINRVAESSDDTHDHTDYRLGLSYQATEHLTFELMYDSESNSPGGVNTKVVYGSAVLAF